MHTKFLKYFKSSNKIWINFRKINFQSFFFTISNNYYIYILINKFSFSRDIILSFRFLFSFSKKLDLSYNKLDLTSRNLVLSFRFLFSFSKNLDLSFRKLDLTSRELVLSLIYLIWISLWFISVIKSLIVEEFV